ncbi:MAG: tRNA (adenosine(37)-N6)-threonylcarbamoyltransferase complex dimerization subunit type 1 TsaB, partial [Micromonosporaceae bacterium]|nr:tRNA (adenosine(37)-N6)-threonylcarbamoyltransferase complex dimerization subunit type 1 TsaB [Micromonosporaceae bacterium]
PPALAHAQLAAPRELDRSPGDALTPLYLRRPDAAQPHSPKAVTA